MLTAWLIEHYFGPDFRLSKLRNVLGLISGGNHRDRGLGRRRDHYIQIVSQRDDADPDDLAALARIGRPGNHHGCTIADRARLGLAGPAAVERARRRCADGHGAGARECDLPFSCGGSFWRMSGRSRCCSLRCCGLPPVAGRCSPRQPLSSSAFRSFGRPLLALVISAIQVCPLDQRVRSGAIQHSPCNARRARFLPRCLPKSATRGDWPKLPCMRAKHNATSSRPKGWRRSAAWSQASPTKSHSPIGTSLTVASTLAHRSADFTDQIASRQVRRAVLVEFADACRGATEQLVANLQRAADLIQSFKQVAVDRSSDDRRAFDLKLVDRAGRGQRAIAP